MAKEFKANIPAIKAIYEQEATVHTHTKKVIALTMRAFNCTFTEIGEVLDISRQGAEQLVKSVK